MKKLYNRIKNRITQEWQHFLVDNFPKYVLSRLWFQEMGYHLDWNNPKDLNEKIQWLILNSDTTIWSELTDKVQVREYVDKKGLGHLLVPIYGVWENGEDIEFEKLPNKFVLKCNHDSASVKIIDKKLGYDKKALVTYFNNKLRIKFGYLSCEPHYNRIKPRIIAEQFLKLDGAGISSTPVDYKVWCFSGEPFAVWVAYNRDNLHGHVDTELYDLNWNYHREYSRFTDHYHDGGGRIPRPKSLDEMIKSARILSSGFPEVRVDFYDVDGKLYFGEMTFTSDCGRMPFYSKEFLLKAGEKIDLSLAHHKKK